MIFNFDEMPDRRATESLKWNRYGPDVMPLWVADMDFISPPVVTQALHDRIDHGVFGYALPDPNLLDMIVDRMDRLYNWKITPQDIVLIPGVVPGFNLACNAFAAPGGSMVIQTPVYPPFLRAADNAGIRRVDARLAIEPDGTYSIDFNSLKESLTPQAKTFLLCSPHNPVGRVFRREELEKMAHLCLQNNTVIISDEIHCDLLFPGYTHIPIASLSREIAMQTITLMAPSKTYNIAGLDFSFAIIQNPEYRKRLEKARRGLLPSLNLMGQIAAIAAYSGGQDWLDQVLVYLKTNRDLVFDFVNNELPGIKMARPEGTYLAWLDCRNTPISADPYTFFLEKAHIALGDGRTFGPGGDGFVRLNFACPRSYLEAALEKMKKALAA